MKNVMSVGLAVAGAGILAIGISLGYVTIMLLGGLFLVTSCMPPAENG